MNLPDSVKYYYLLFGIVIVTRIIRVYLEQRLAGSAPATSVASESNFKNENIDEIASDYAASVNNEGRMKRFLPTKLKLGAFSENFYVGLDIVFAASGVFTYLISNKIKHAIVYLPLFVLLIVIAIYFELIEDKLKKVIGNFSLVLLISFITYNSFPSDTDNLDWRVSVPYVDFTLNRHVGANASIISHVIIPEEAPDPDTAKAKAEKDFYEKNMAKPLYPNDEGAASGRGSLQIEYQDVIAELSHSPVI